MNQLYLYAIIGLGLALLATVGGFSVYYKTSSLKIETLTIQASKLEDAVKANEQTIIYLKEENQKISDANKIFISKLAETEKTLNKELSRIDNIKTNEDDLTQAEKDANEEFKKSIESLRNGVVNSIDNGKLHNNK